MAGPMKPGAGLRGKDNTGRIMRRKTQAILGVLSAAADAVLAYLTTTDADGGMVSFGSNVTVFGKKAPAWHYSRRLRRHWAMFR